MTLEADLLVHIGASSTRQDDERYRAQASAYFGFNGHVMDQIAIATISREHAFTQRSTGGEQADGSIVLEDETTVFLDDTQLAYAALDSGLQTSSLVIEDHLVARSFSRHSEVSQELDADEIIQSEEPRLGNSNDHDADESQADHHDFDRREISSNARNSICAEGLEDNDEPAIRSYAERTPQQAPPATHPFSQSSYLRTPILDRSSKRQRLTASKQPELDRPRYVALRENSHLGLAYIGDRAIRSTEPASQTGHENLQTVPAGRGPRASSELPTTYSLSDITSESSRAKSKRDGSQRSVSDPGPRTNTSGDSANLFRPTVVSQDHAEEAKAQQQANRSVAQPFSVVKAVAEDPLLEVIKALPTTIHPPEPPVGLGKFTTHITPSLHNLANNSNLSQAYHPALTKRDIDPLERGHWLVNCSSWPLQAQIDLWRFLEQTVGIGSAGWGVWCYRMSEGDEVEGSGSGDGSRDVEAGGVGDRARLGFLKVYCWGEVVKHVYLLLYSGSLSRVRKMGLQWIDAEGKVVVQMESG